jgi:hypothetical protein
MNKSAQPLNCFPSAKSVLSARRTDLFSLHNNYNTQAPLARLPIYLLQHIIFIDIFHFQPKPSINYITIEYHEVVELSCKQQ